MTMMLYGDNPYAQNISQLNMLRKNSDMEIFRKTKMYQEIKAACTLPATDCLEEENWSLTYALMKRESNWLSNSFTGYQHRRIANEFIPNFNEKTLMLCGSNVLISQFNKDGNKLIIVDSDAIRLYNYVKGDYEPINFIEIQDEQVFNDLDISQCGKFFVYSEGLDHLTVVPMDGSMDDTQLLYLNKNQTETRLYSLRCSPNSRWITACNDTRLYVCDRESGRTQAFRTAGISRNIQMIALSYVSTTDSEVFVTGSEDGTIKLWDKRCLYPNKSNIPVSVFRGHLDRVTFIDSRNIGCNILSNSVEESIKLWDLRRPTCDGKTVGDDDSIMTFRGHSITTLALARAKFSPTIQTGQRFIYTGCSTGSIMIYDVLTGEICESILSHDDAIMDLSWHPIRSEIISCSFDGNVNLSVHVPEDD